MAADKKINVYQKRVTQELLKRVSEKLTLKFENIREGVDRIMSGYIERTTADEILEQGIEQGIDRGIDQGS